MSDRWIAVLDRLLTVVVRLVWLNACWVGLTLLGGVVLGFGPATVAAHAVAIRWLRGEPDLAIGKTMWQQWRQHFLRASSTTVLAGVVTVSLLATWRLGGLPVAGLQGPIPTAITRGLSTVGLVLMAVMVPHIAWVVERTRLPVRRTLLAAFAAGLSRPLLTLTLLILGVGWPLLLVLVGWPGLLPVCGMSVPIVAAAWCLARVFPHHGDEKHQQLASNTTESGLSSPTHH